MRGSDGVSDKLSKKYTRLGILMKLKMGIYGSMGFPNVCKKI